MITEEGYFDIHTHILPGVDDGSSNMEETIEMLQIARQQGVSHIIATPHYNCGSNNKSAEELQYLRDQVQTEAEKINGSFQIYLGNELYYSDSIIEDLKCGKALTLAGSFYVLVEFSVRASHNTIYNGIKSLILAGYAPILAHVERYECLNRKVDLIMGLIELGCYIQMNSSSLKGGFMDKEAAYNRKLFYEGMIHFLGSDCHGRKHRMPLMEDTVKILKKKSGSRHLEKILYQNPRMILENKYV